VAASRRHTGRDAGRLVMDGAGPRVTALNRWGHRFTSSIGSAHQVPKRRSREGKPGVEPGPPVLALGHPVGVGLSHPLPLRSGQAGGRIGHLPAALTVCGRRNHPHRSKADSTCVLTAQAEQEAGSAMSSRFPPSSAGACGASGQARRRRRARRSSTGRGTRRSTRGTPDSHRPSHPADSPQMRQCRPRCR
jgi:hypothetical protein